MDNTGYCKQCESLADENAALRADLANEKAGRREDANDYQEHWNALEEKFNTAEEQLALHREALKVLAEKLVAASDECDICPFFPIDEELDCPPCPSAEELVATRTDAALAEAAKRLAGKDAAKL